MILVRPETTPDDVLGMQVSNGILTTRGGMVSHAAVVARGWGIPAVVGAGDVHIDGDRVTIGAERARRRRRDHDRRQHGQDLRRRARHVGRRRRRPSSTRCWPGPTPSPRARAGARQRRHRGRRQPGPLTRRPGDRPVPHGAHVPRRRPAADHAPVHPRRRRPRPRRRRSPSSKRPRPPTSRRCSRRWTALPVTVRLLDPPLHEFLPDLLELTARQARGELDAAERGRDSLAVRRLHEANPMIGTRGVRLGVRAPRPLRDAGAGVVHGGRQPVRPRQASVRRDHDPARRRGRGAADRPLAGCARCSTRSGIPS